MVPVGEEPPGLSERRTRGCRRALCKNTGSSPLRLVGRRAGGRGGGRAQGGSPRPPGSPFPAPAPAASAPAFVRPVLTEHQRGALFQMLEVPRGTHTVTQVADECPAPGEPRGGTTHPRAGRELGRHGRTWDPPGAGQVSARARPPARAPASYRTLPACFLFCKTRRQSLLSLRKAMAPGDVTAAKRALCTGSRSIPITQTPDSRIHRLAKTTRDPELRAPGASEVTREQAQSGEKFRVAQWHIPGGGGTR